MRDEFNVWNLGCADRDRRSSKYWNNTFILFLFNFKITLGLVCFIGGFS